MEVRFFEKYPIEKIVRLPGEEIIDSGPLDGYFKVCFNSGKSLKFRSSGSLFYEKINKTQIIYGNFTVNDYIARVIDREIKPKPTEAAKAFAIVIRTYLMQNAKQNNGCFHISDSSRFQRVSIHSSTKEARSLSYWTDTLVIKGVPSVHYHSNRSSLNVLSWLQAKKLANEGYYFDEILRTAYPSGKIGVMYLKRNCECDRLTHIESWLRSKSKKWQVYLSAKPGYEPPEQIEVCRLISGNPYADFDKNRIFAKSLNSIEDKITLTHEYLHLAFKHHPLGADDEFIENTAKQLILNEGVVYEQF